MAEISAAPRSLAETVHGALEQAARERPDDLGVRFTARRSFTTKGLLEAAHAVGAGYSVDRKKDAIRRGGENLSSSEVSRDPRPLGRPRSGRIRSPVRSG